MNTPFPAYLETIAPLGISAVFTGAARDSRFNPIPNTLAATAGVVWQTLYSTFNVSLLADQASAANGVVIQGSYNGTTWNNVALSALVLSVPLILSVPVTYPLYRVVVTNGIVAQTAVTIATSFTR
jgi:hypothetical protein